LSSGLKIGFRCLKDARSKPLRIPVDDRKPRALHLHHDSVPFQKDVIVYRKADLIACDRVWSYRLGLLETVSIAPSQNVTGNHQLKTAHLRIGGVFLRINVDDFFTIQSLSLPGLRTKNGAGRLDLHQKAGEARY